MKRSNLSAVKPSHPPLRFLPLIATAILAVGLIAGCGRVAETVASAAVDDQGPEELTAATLVVHPVEWPRVVRVQGTLYADEVSAVGARVSGRIRQVHVQLGDAVEAGQPLVSLDTEEFELMVSQAEAQLTQARAAVGLGHGEATPIADWKDDLDPENSPPVRQQRAIWKEAKASLERAEKLLEQGAISDGEFDLIASAESVAEAGYAAAINAVEEKLSLIQVRRVELELARQRLRDAVILAPFDGFVQNRLVAPGGFLAAGDSVATLVRTDPIWFRGQIPERYAGKLTIGLPVRVQVDSLDQPLEAVVTRISPTLDLASRSLTFEAQLDNSDRRLRSGIFSTAELTIEPESQTLAIPASAVTQFAGSEKVWKLTDGISRQVEIASGGRRGLQIEVLEGLADGDTILVDAAIGRVARVLPVSEPAIPNLANDSKEAKEAIESMVLEPVVGGLLAPTAIASEKPSGTLAGLSTN